MSSPLVVAQERTNALLEQLIEVTRTPEDGTVAPVQPVQWTAVDSSEVVVVQGTRYLRQEKPKLFEVIDYLEQHPEGRGWSVRQLAAVTQVSKSWCAVAKKYYEDVGV